LLHDYCNKKSCFAQGKNLGNTLYWVKVRVKKDQQAVDARMLS